MRRDSTQAAKNLGAAAGGSYAARVLHTALVWMLLLPAMADGQSFAPVRRLLEAHCVACHNSRNATMGLDVTTLRGLRKGGSRGPAVVPGQPDESAAYLMLQSGGMPPAGPPVAAPQVELFRAWIKAGAHWPAGVVLRTRK